MVFGFELNCKPCAGSDPTQDTVKVDVGTLGSLGDKENVIPDEGEREAAKAAGEVAAAAAAKEQRERDAREREARERFQREEEEALRRHEEAEVGAALAAVAAAKEEEERAAMEAERRRQEEEEKALRLAQEQADSETVQTYLKARKFADVNDLRKSMLKAKRPLHSAVKDNDADVVRCLLQANADPSLTNSAGKTPQQVAEALNKADSHAAVLEALQAA